MRIHPQCYFKVKGEGQICDFSQFFLSRMSIAASTKPNDFIIFQPYLICGWVSVISLFQSMRIETQGHFCSKMSIVSSIEPNDFNIFQSYLICG